MTWQFFPLKDLKFKFRFHITVVLLPSPNLGILVISFLFPTSCIFNHQWLLIMAHNQDELVNNGEFFNTDVLWPQDSLMW